MAYGEIEDLRIYKEAEEIADEIWEEVIRWNDFAKSTVGKQLVDSADSIGANMSEAGGRFHIKDVINFLYYSRGSMRETKFWLRRTITRKLMEQGKAEKLINRINNLAPQLNSYIASKRKRKSNPGNPAT